MMRSVVLYLILVGIPIAGISAVLRIGQKLVAPASFAGRWEVEAWPDSVCSMHGPDTLHLTIEQSGPSLTIRSRNGPRFEGRVVDKGFTAKAWKRREIRATQTPGENGSQFVGTVSGSPCDAATRSRIVATRVSSSSQLRGH